MLIQTALLAFVAGSCSWSAEAINCYSCTNATRLTDCTKRVECPVGSACFTNYSTVQGVRLYTLGCTSVWSCPTITTASTYGASTIGRSNSTTAASSPDTCSECCNTGHCNRQQCQNEDLSCRDDINTDCPTMSAKFDICTGDVSNAKQYCKRFCGFCNNDHGGWSSWSEWGSCSVTCDVGLQRRDRTCTTRFPVRHRNNCIGNSRDDRLCFPGACANGSWSRWGPWSPCARTCGGGVKTRSRNCDSPAPSMTGKYCDGDPTQAESCNILPCQGPVVFMAKHLSTLTPGRNGPLIFTQTDTNVGNGYNNNTGIFTAPVAGTYSFNVQFCVDNNNYAVVGLFVDDVQKTSMLTFASQGWPCRTLSYPAILKHGDNVQARADPTSYAISQFFQDSVRINSFSGALLR